jgi:hypothetical protein
MQKWEEQKWEEQKWEEQRWELDLLSLNPRCHRKPECKTQGNPVEKPLAEEGEAKSLAEVNSLECMATR